MSWLDEFTKAAFSLNAGQTIEGYQPIDFYHFFPLWYNLFIKRNVLALRQINAFKKSYPELKNLLSTPSNLRSFLQKSVPAYMGLREKDPENFKIFTSFISRMLTEACPNDPFALNSNPWHSKKEIKEIIEKTSWQKADPVLARLNGQLVTAAGSLVHGLYNDLVTDFGWDAYGPYENLRYQNKNYTLFIRDFPNLQPRELWPNNLLAPVKEIKILQLYQDVKWKIECVGCHTNLVSGNPITGLKYYAMLLDGRSCGPAEARVLVQELSEKAERLYGEIRKKDFEELKQMVMLQECYQLKKVFDAAKIDWRPTPEMLEQIKDKALLSNLLPQGKFMNTLEEYRETFGFNLFAREVLKN